MYSLKALYLFGGHIEHILGIRGYPDDLVGASVALGIKHIKDMCLSFEHAPSHIKFCCLEILIFFGLYD